MALLSYYKDIFGAPNTGIHSYRLFDIAIVDLLFTILVSYLITYIMRWFRHDKLDVDLERCDIVRPIKTSFTFLFIMNTIYLLLLAIFIHGLFGVNTKLNTILFGKC